MAACIFCIIGFTSQANCGAETVNYPKCSWIATGVFGAENYLNMNSYEVYLYAILWALYTAITIGYGNIVPVGNLERLFAVLTMVVSSILCDAGLYQPTTSTVLIQY